MLIGEFAKYTGVSVRTLHYYDEIGLLKPIMCGKENGYRVYDENSAHRMAQILYYRELGFSLKSTGTLIDCQKNERECAMKEQKRLLELKRKRLDRLIDELDRAQKGEAMSFKAFDNSEYIAARDNYAEEVKSRWGNTGEYRQYSENQKEISPQRQEQIDARMNGLLEEFAALTNDNVDPAGQQAQTLVQKWRELLTKNYYECSIEILSCLGEMYSADERFKQNIDKAGAGTADFMTRAIREYCVKYADKA